MFWQLKRMTKLRLRSTDRWWCCLLRLNKAFDKSFVGNSQPCHQISFGSIWYPLYPTFVPTPDWLAHEYRTLLFIFRSLQNADSVMVGITAQITNLDILTTKQRREICCQFWKSPSLLPFFWGNLLTSCLVKKSWTVWQESAEDFSKVLPTPRNVIEKVRELLACDVYSSEEAWHWKAQMDIFKGFIDYCTFSFQSQPELFMTLQPDVSADYFVFNPNAIVQGGMNFIFFYILMKHTHPKSVPLVQI